MSEKPLVSVIIPSYNHERYVEEAVRSVWNQTYRPIELIVVDDASQDGSVEILRRLEKESPIPMRVYVNEKNLGLPATLNRGLEKIAGEYVVIFASDDRIPEDRILMHMARFFQEKETDVIYGDMEEMDATGQVKSRISLRPASTISLKNFILGRSPLRLQTMTIRKGVFDIVGKFDPSVRLEDVDFYLRCFLHGIRMLYVPYIAVQYRRHDHQTIERHEWIVEGMNEIFKKYADQVPSRLLRLFLERSRVYHAFWSNPGRLRAFVFLKHWMKYPEDYGAFKTFLYHIFHG